MTSELVRRLGTSAVVAVDPSETFVTAVQERHPAIDVRRAAAERLPFDRRSVRCGSGAAGRPLLGARPGRRAAGDGPRHPPRRRRGGVCVGSRRWHGDRSPRSGTPCVSSTRTSTTRRRCGRRSPGPSRRAVPTRAGLREIEEGAISVRVEHPSFDEWWGPVHARALGAGRCLRGPVSTSNGAASSVNGCRQTLPAGPFALSARAWTAAVPSDDAPHRVSLSEAPTRGSRRAARIWAWIVSSGLLGRRRPRIPGMTTPGSEVGTDAPPRRQGKGSARVTEDRGLVSAMLVTRSSGSTKLVPLLDGRMVRYVNLDNAATTPPLHAVVDAVEQFLPFAASVHRGTGFKSRASTRRSRRRGRSSGDSSAPTPIATSSSSRRTPPRRSTSSPGRWSLPDGASCSPRSSSTTPTCCRGGGGHRSCTSGRADGSLDEDDLDDQLARHGGQGGSAGGDRGLERDRRDAADPPARRQGPRRRGARSSSTRRSWPDIDASTCFATTTPATSTPSPSRRTSCTPRTARERDRRPPAVRRRSRLSRRRNGAGGHPRRRRVGRPARPCRGRQPEPARSRRLRRSGATARRHRAREIASHEQQLARYARSRLSTLPGRGVGGRVRSSA